MKIANFILCLCLATISTSPFAEPSAADKKLIENVDALINDSNPNGNPHKTASHTDTVLPVHRQPISTNPNALLPNNRIVAYYGNFYSKRMGVLGAHPPEEMLSMLGEEAAKWRKVDPGRPVIPAIDYIAVVAQGSPGSDGKYRNRMPEEHIQKAIDLAEQVNGIAILDVQVGLSNVHTELPLLESYLALPHVMLALDPEFSMKSGARPGTVIGTMDAADINYAANYLADLVRKHDLPPKILIVHRFTEHMVTNYRSINPLPEVQIVMDMDGWGPQAKKRGTYQSFIAAEPVQYTGFKLFYVNDLKAPSTGLFTPVNIAKLVPEPLFILYQ